MQFFDELKTFCFYPYPACIRPPPSVLTSSISVSLSAPGGQQATSHRASESSRTRAMTRAEACGVDIESPVMIEAAAKQGTQERMAIVEEGLEAAMAAKDLPKLTSLIRVAREELGDGRKWQGLAPA